MSIAPWSFSKVKLFEQCPKKFYHLKVAKDYSEPITSAMTYGNQFHTACEEYIRDGKELPERFDYVKDALDALARKSGDKLCEYKMGITENLEPCDFNSKDVWFRGIADLLIVDREKSRAWVVDYKTGKDTKYADKGQLELMALATFKHFPGIQRVKAGLLFVIPKELIREEYTVSDVPRLWGKWISSVEDMKRSQAKDVWNPRPSGLCRRHCIVTECVHNGRN